MASPLAAFADIYAPPKSAMVYDAYCGSAFDMLGTFVVPAALAFSVVVFLYMLGKVLKNNELSRYLVLESYDTFIFIVLLLTLVPFLYSFGCFSFLIGGVPTYVAGFLYWDSMARNLSLDGLVLQLAAAVFAPIMTASISLGPSSGTALAGFWTFTKSFLSNVMTAMGIALGLSYAFLYLYQFLTYGLLKVLLPLGVALRAIPFTKKLGGTLFGLAVGMAFFLPIVSALMFTVTNNIVTLQFDAASGSYVSNSATLVNAFNEMFLSIFEIMAPSDIADAVKKATQQTASATTGIPEQQVESALFDDLSDPLKHDVSVKASKVAVLTAGVAALTGLAKVAKTKKTASYIAQGLAPNEVQEKLKWFDWFINFTSTLGTAGIFFISLSLAFVVSLEVSVVVATIFISFAILITSIKMFTGLFGEPLDVSNLTRLV